MIGITALMLLLLMGYSLFAINPRDDEPA